MSDQELFELQAFNDWREIRRRGFEVDESKPDRARPGFSSYVVMPSLLFGLLTSIMTASALIVLAVVMSYITVTAVDSFPDIIIGSSIGTGAVIMAYSAVLLIDDWRSLQWHRKKRVFLGEPKRERPTVRYYDQLSGSTLVGSTIDWHPRWKELLARRVYNERAEWIGGQSAVRDKHFGPSTALNQPQLYTNVTGMWEEVRRYLVRIEYIDTVEDCNWTEKAKGELLARLRIV